MEAASALAERLDARLFLDVEGLGEWVNHERAWRWLASQPGRWHVVIQDDALLIAGFAQHAAAALAHAPRTAVSFYVGTGRPRARRVTAAVQQAREQDASWLECDGLLWGVAIAMPAEHIGVMLGWAEDQTLPYDQRISQFYRRVLHQRVRHTWPSLVDHADGPGLVRHHSPTVPRRAHALGAPARWDGPVIRI